jgi:hypothetical protein
MVEHDAFGERERALENEYFRKKDLELIEKMRRAAATEQAQVEMGQKTGLKDPALLKELQDLGFTPDTVALLPLMPMLEVAWAEGEITAAERQQLVRLARSRGIQEGDPADRQLTTWMTERPTYAVFRSATRLTAALLDSGSPSVVGDLSPEALVAYCEEIAAASGGLLGTRFMNVSTEERELLARIASDLKARGT